MENWRPLTCFSSSCFRHIFKMLNENSNVLFFNFKFAIFFSVSDSDLKKPEDEPSNGASEENKEGKTASWDTRTSKCSHVFWHFVFQLCGKQNQVLDFKFTTARYINPLLMVTRVLLYLWSESEGIQNMAVVLDNVSYNMSRDLLSMLVENMMGLDDSDYNLEIIWEKNAAVITFRRPSGRTAWGHTNQTAEIFYSYRQQ